MCIFKIYLFQLEANYFTILDIPITHCLEARKNNLCVFYEPYTVKLLKKTWWTSLCKLVSKRLQRLISYICFEKSDNSFKHSFYL